jgi:hypothetical protein
MSNPNISFTTESGKKEYTRREAELRGQTLSEAMGMILEYGLPIYLEKVPRKFEPVGETAVSANGEAAASG